jgi:hypothetical protein
MKGYVQNMSQQWAHAMKRTIGPGAKVPLEELYDQYGKKHDLRKGTQFTTWLRDIKLPNKDVWKIISNPTAKQEVEEVVVQRETAEGDKLNPNKMEVQDVILLPVRKAREVLPEISDIKLLKYAYQQARQLANKDSLCIILKRRITELETVSRI